MKPGLKREIETILSALERTPEAGNGKAME